MVEVYLMSDFWCWVLVFAWVVLTIPISAVLTPIVGIIWLVGGGWVLNELDWEDTE